MTRTPTEYAALTAAVREMFEVFGKHEAIEQLHLFVETLGRTAIDTDWLRAGVASAMRTRKFLPVPAEVLDDVRTEQANYEHWALRPATPPPPPPKRKGRPFTPSADDQAVIATLSTGGQAWAHVLADLVVPDDDPRLLKHCQACQDTGWRHVPDPTKLDRTTVERCFCVDTNPKLSRKYPGAREDR